MSIENYFFLHFYHLNAFSHIFSFLNSPILSHKIFSNIFPKSQMKILMDFSTKYFQKLYFFNLFSNS